MKKKALYKQTPFIVGALLSAVVFGVFAYFLSVGEVCNWAGACETKWQYLQSASPNEIGDTLAGFAGTLAFIWIVVTVWLQAEELQEQRLEFATMNSTMSEQLFETTFFEIISTLNDLVNSIDLHNVQNGQTTSGRDCFSVFYTRLNKRFRKLQTQSHPKALEIAYNKFWLDYQAELGHYFRFLYRAFLLLKENPSAKEYHVKLLRSQLSDQELLLIFYNCVTENGSKFKELATKFELFDNLPTVKLLETEHVDLINKKSFGGNPMKTPKNIRVPN
ncbi:MAG: putative phage abortive infection protein [Ruegeria sp.]